jgi:hypothetical protein
VAGFDFPAKLRRGLGQGQVLPREQIERLLSPFDSDSDGALTRVELASFLKASSVGGVWFCDWAAKGLWDVCERWYAREVAWIKIELLATAIHETMRATPRLPKRVRLTPEGVAGYEDLEWLDGSGPISEGHPSVRNNSRPGLASSRAPTQPPTTPDRGSSVPGSPGPGAAPRPASAVSNRPMPRPRGPATPAGRPGPAPRGAAPAPRRPGPGPRR